MNRNGLVFVPREPPKRVILYPTQDSAKQQQQSNGFYGRAKTTIVTNDPNGTSEQSQNITGLSRQQPFSNSANNTVKHTDKNDNDKTVPNTTMPPTTVNIGQKFQIPYSANPFFRPKVVPNQQSTVNTNTAPTNRDSAAPNINGNIQTVISSTTTAAAATTTTTVLNNREKQSAYLKPQNSISISNGRTQETEPTVSASSAQDDNRRWAHAVSSASAPRRTVNDERSIGTFKQSETAINCSSDNDSPKQKAASATDIVISLMDTWRAPLNLANTAAVNIFARPNAAKDDSTVAVSSSTAGEQLPDTPSFVASGNASTANSNNQNWRKTLLANFQKNSRNIPTAKLFNAKQTTTPPQPSTTTNNDITTNQPQQKVERTTFNGINNERTFQANDMTPMIASMIRKSSESLRVAKHDENNHNNSNNIERSTSLQIQGSAYSNLATTTTPTANKPSDVAKSIEVTNSDSIPHGPVPLPAGLATSKPSASVEQQRAIITRVMIRRDFVKTNESRPAMPTAVNMRSYIGAKSATPGGLPTNNVIQVATITNNNSGINSNVTTNRMHAPPPLPPQQQQIQEQFQRLQTQQTRPQTQQHQQTSIPLSQKSILSFVNSNPTARESTKAEINQQPSNSVINEAMNSSSAVKMQQSSTSINNSAAVRSTSLSAANVESRRKKEEINNKMKKRAISASAASDDG